jgi:hypothetical protein
MMGHVLDRVANVAIVLYGAALVYDKIVSERKGGRVVDWRLLIVILGTFLGTIGLYYGGCVLSMFCFCDDEDTAYRWHSFLHLLTSVGHHCILLLHL